MDSTDLSVFSKLPEEVWTRIFYFMPANDRKSYRSSCRRFYDACHRLSIQAVEEMVFRGNINSIMALQSLSSLPRQIWNIRLKNVYLADDSVLSFFQQNGAKILSLTFNKCYWSPTILRKIIKFCNNLQNISLIFDAKIDLIVMEEFEALRNERIVRETVVSFTLEQQSIIVQDDSDEDITLTNETFSCFFEVFPNIANLAVTVNTDKEFRYIDTIPDYAAPNQIFTFSCISHQLRRMDQQLKKLKLHFNHHPLMSIEVPQVGSVPFSEQILYELANINGITNVKDFQINWIHPGKTKIRNLNPLLQFKHLTSFNLRTESTSIASKLTSLLLNTATELQSLTVKLEKAGGVISEREFCQLVKSKLITLNYYPYKYFVPADEFNEYSVCADFDQSPILQSLSPNYTLKHLYARSRKSESNLLQWLTYYFRNLKSLVVEDINERILHNILKYNINLCKLVLCNCKHFPYRNSSTVSNTSFHQWLQSKDENFPENRIFNRLTHLYIKEDEYLGLFKWILRTFEFPVLKSLAIEVVVPWNRAANPSDEIEPFLQIIQKFTQLEYLEIQWKVVTSFEQWFPLISGLPKLRHILFRNFHSTRFDKECYYVSARNFHSTLFDDEEYRKLLQVSPSLRTVVNDGPPWHNNIKYYKNISADDEVLYIRRSAYETFDQFYYEGVPSYYYENKFLGEKFVHN